MKTTTGPGQALRSIGDDFIERLGEESWTYIKTVVDIVREPILILDKGLFVMAANEPFYKTFHVKPEETLGKIVYELGNGQWNIPALRKLLENILPKDTFFKGFEVAHEFPFIGRKVMILNARQIHCKEDATLGPCPLIILLAIEDITEMMAIAETLAKHTNEVEDKLAKQAQEQRVFIEKLQKEINELKKESKHL